MSEVDPNGIAQHAAGAKLDAGKPDASLLLMFGRALTEVARVGTFGAKKYSRGGWQSVADGQNRYTAALVRHLFAENVGPHDDESGLRHAAQVAWNSLARLELMLREEENNNAKERSVEHPSAARQVAEVPTVYLDPFRPGLTGRASVAGQVTGSIESDQHGLPSNYGPGSDGY